MKQIRKRLTYANVMSTIAVFLILGGATALAATKLGKNSVGTKQIKNNAVTSAKIKKNAITAVKIKNDTITGTQVNAATLGTVPSATNATNATNSTNATNWSRYFTSGLVKASAGQTVPLLSIGPFTITGQCKGLGGGEVEASTFITTSQTGSSMASYEKSYEEANFDPGTEAELSYPVSGTTPESSQYKDAYEYNGFTAASADGKTLLGGEAANAVNYFGANCAFWVSATNNA